MHIVVAAGEPIALDIRTGVFGYFLAEGAVIAIEVWIILRVVTDLVTAVPTRRTGAEATGYPCPGWSRCGSGDTGNLERGLCNSG
jgi:hypothetical protein